MKKSVIFKSIFFLACCLCFFVLVGAVTFNMNVVKSDAKPQENIEKSPLDIAPLGILIVDDESNGALVAFLNFNTTTTQLILLKDKQDLSFCPYTINRKLTLSKSNIKEIIDLSGGIILKNENGNLRYTGTQVLELLYKKKENKDISEIILQIFYSLSLKADEEFFLFLANNTQCDISYIDFYKCKDALSDTLLNCVITVEE